MNEGNTTIEYYIYTRKSTESEDKQVLSIDSQTDELKKIACDNKIKIKAIESEAHSAKAPGRPVFNKMIKEIEAGKAQGLLVWHANRLSRNSVDTGLIIYLLDIGKLKEVRTPGQIFRDNPNDKFLLNLFCSQAKVDIANNMGYTTPKHKRIGGKPMVYSAAYVMFRDPFYYGMFEFPKGSGNWFRGRHTPMVTEEEFRKVQEMLGGTENERPHIHTFAFTGMIRCGECGCMITAENKTKRQKNGTVHHYTYYHCTKRKLGPKCTQSVVQQNDLEGQIIATLDQLDISQEVHDFGMKWMREQNAKDSVNTNAVLTNLQKDYKDCVAVIDGLIDMRAREELNKEDFQRRMEDAQKEKKRLEELLNDTGDQIDKRIKFANEAFEFVEHATIKFKTGEWEKKKEILSTLGSNLSLMDKKLSISLENSLVPLKTVSLLSRREIAKVRTAKNAENKQEIEQSLARSQSMLRE
ncbi:MAG: recombinase family protein [bacterium]